MPAPSRTFNATDGQHSITVNDVGHWRLLKGTETVSYDEGQHSRTYRNPERLTDEGMRMLAREILRDFGLTLVPLTGGQ